MLRPWCCRRSRPVRAGPQMKMMAQSTGTAITSRSNEKEHQKDLPQLDLSSIQSLIICPVFYQERSVGIIGMDAICRRSIKILQALVHGLSAQVRKFVL